MKHTDNNFLDGIKVTEILRPGPAANFGTVDTFDDLRIGDEIKVETSRKDFSLTVTWCAESALVRALREVNEHARKQGARLYFNENGDLDAS